MQEAASRRDAQPERLPSTLAPIQCVIPHRPKTLPIVDGASDGRGFGLRVVRPGSSDPQQPRQTMILIHQTVGRAASLGAGRPTIWTRASRNRRALCADTCHAPSLPTTDKTSASTAASARRIQVLPIQ